MNTKNNTPVWGPGVIIDQDHILLCKTLDLSISFYFLPGGHVENMVNRLKHPSFVN